MASFTKTFVYEIFTSNDGIRSSFSSFICSKVSRASLVLVSMFAPSIFWKKGVRKGSPLSLFRGKKVC